MRRPYLVAAWPDIGNVGILAVDALRIFLKARKFAEINSFDSYPLSASVHHGVLGKLDFPKRNFYFQKLKSRDVIFFMSGEQPLSMEEMRETAKAILKVANDFHCRKIYSLDAISFAIHHLATPKVFAVAGNEKSLKDSENYNVFRLSDFLGNGEQRLISGAGSFLTAFAAEAGINSLSLLAEMPFYLTEVIPYYPKASKALVDVMVDILNIPELDLSWFDNLVGEINQSIEKIYEGFPPSIKQKIDKLKNPSRGISLKEKRDLFHAVDKIFQKSKSTQKNGGDKNE